MKRLLAILILLTTTKLQAMPAIDSQLHFLASYSLTATANQAFHKQRYSLLKASAVAFGIGLVKEALDGHVSSQDITSNLLGIATYGIFSLTFSY